MKDPTPNGPFAEFAAPKPGGVKAYKARIVQDRKRNREQLLFLGSSLIGTALGSSVAVSMGLPLSGFLAALGLSLVGCALGLLVGWLIAAASWATLWWQSRGPGPFKPVGSELVADNSGKNLSIWLRVWGLIGILCGGCVGAMKGVMLVTEGIQTGVLLPWSMSGSAAGMLLTITVWLVIKRSVGRSHGKSV
jgi:hypothetical protein